jgi:PilZ domain-containing protein
MTSVTLRVRLGGVSCGRMSKYDQTGEGPEAGKEHSSQPDSSETGKPMLEQNKGRKPYNDMQSAARFPLKLPVAVKSETGQRAAETQNISANGVLFQVDADMPVGSMVDFTISLPADVVGADSDVQLDCRGRVVRSFDEDGRHGVGVVIDEYRFDRR